MPEPRQQLRHEEGRVRTADGWDLFWQAWLPPCPKAVLLFVHGLAEHSGRYAGTCGELACRGYACYALDCRGHGKSPGLRVHVDGIEDFLEDVRSLHRLAAGRHPEARAFLVGHSQGGLVVLHYALRDAGGLAGIVVSSPFLGIHPASRPSPGLRLAAKVLSGIAPRLLFPSGLDPRLLSRDEAVVRAYREDPLVSRKVSARWFTAALKAVKEVRGQAGRLTLPALLMASGEDRIVDPEAVRGFATAAPKDRVEFVRWEGLYHEMFNEPEKERVILKVESWLEARLGLRTP